MGSTDPIRVGVTGGIGAGKSIVCRIFAGLGVPVYDADTQAKKLMNKDPYLTHEIKKYFGEKSYKNGQLNREYLSNEVFNDPEKLEQLNQLVHPRVGEDSNEWMRQHNNFAYLIKEAALLFESGAYKELDKIIVVTAPEETRVKRVMQRDPFRSREEVIKIIRNQLSEEEKMRRADYLIFNDERTLVIPQVLKLHERFIHHFKK
ncbi:MAG: Dephospho-CoA kinase [Cytophagales bacterium]|jgi:dephospho-CoA kinase|nr:dephospho-CoA kinase [Bacteroidota bacterium]MBS1979840.1 dephospho-CoA kinase [Bacteroidota bacterium]WHZ07126.1 MAG: Dephospho-CoA kinase [Cytophagales bacterium]